MKKLVNMFKFISLEIYVCFSHNLVIFFTVIPLKKIEINKIIKNDLKEEFINMNY